jgi:hypothetical protein
VARAVYSRKLISGVVTAGLPLEFIILDTETLVVRDIRLNIGAAPAAGELFTLDLDGIAFYAVGIPAGGLYVTGEELRAVAPGPTVLRAQLDLGSIAEVVCHISGYVLTP